MVEVLFFYTHAWCIYSNKKFEDCVFASPKRFFLPAYGAKLTEVLELIQKPITFDFCCMFLINLGYNVIEGSFGRYERSSL